MPRLLMPCLTLVFLLPGCLQEADAVSPWGAGDVGATEAAAEAMIDADEVAPPGTWLGVQVPVEVGETLVDLVGVDEDGAHALYFVTDAGHVGRSRDGQPAELAILPPGDVPLPYRGIATADGKRFWLVGHGGLVLTVQHLFTSYMLPTRVSGTQKEENLGDWNDIWLEAGSPIWLAGDDGYFMRLDKDGKDPRRFKNHAAHWTTLTGAGAHAWIASAVEGMRLTNGDDIDPDPITATVYATALGDAQFITRLFARDEEHLFLAGKPVQLIRLAVDQTMQPAGPHLTFGSNTFFDVHASPGGPLLACGEQGALVTLGEGDVEDVPSEGLPAGYGYKRVWVFSDGAAYLLTSFGDLYYREPQ